MAWQANYLNLGSHHVPCMYANCSSGDDEPLDLRPAKVLYYVQHHMILDPSNPLQPRVFAVVVWPQIHPSWGKIGNLLKFGVKIYMNLTLTRDSYRSAEYTVALWWHMKQYAWRMSWWQFIGGGLVTCLCVILVTFMSRFGKKNIFRAEIT